jgi:hypothetical protein
VDQVHSNFPNADLQKVFANKIKRVQICIDARGRHYQNLLQVHSDFPNALRKLNQMDAKIGKEFAKMDSCSNFQQARLSAARSDEHLSVFSPTVQHRW